MYYDTYRGKNTREKRRRPRRGCMASLGALIVRLLVMLLVVALLAVGALYILPVSMMNIEPAGKDLSLTDGLPGDRVNILLLGLDFLDEGQQRSDAILIASIGRDCVRLTSVMRDTMVDIPGYGRHKLNSAYSYGGVEMTMRVINQTFALNITNYAVVDLCALVDLVDAVGGVDVELDANELSHLNHNAWDTYKRIILRDGEKYAHYAASTPVTQTGTVHLNGLFAAAYARIRHADSDYMRAARQREVISGALSELRSNVLRPSMYRDLWQIVQESVQTNLTLPELISLGEKALVCGEIQTLRMPVNEYMNDNGSTIEITNYTENIRALHTFIYS